MEFLPNRLTPQESNAVVDRIEAHFRAKGFGLYAAELRSNNSFIGYIGLHTPSFEAHFTPCVEIGWRLAANVWGQGLATEAALAVVRHAFTTLQLPEIVSFTVPANLRSTRIMEKIGMTQNPAEAFDHPSLPAGHPLRLHVLYRLRNSETHAAVAPRK